DADGVLRLLDLPLDVGDGLGRRRDQDLGLAHVDQARHAALLAELDELERLRPRVEGAAGDEQLLVQSAEREVGGSQVRDQGRHDEAPGGVRREEIGAGGLGAAAEPAPEVELVAEIEPAGRREGLLRLKRPESAFYALIRRARVAIHLAELERGRDGELAW